MDAATESPRLATQRKAEILNELHRLYVDMMTDGNWCCHWGVESRERGKPILTSVCGWGDSPDAAIEYLWKDATDIPANRYLVINAMSSEKRRAVRWNGYMWADVQED